MRGGPSYGVQRLLSQARKDAAEYAAVTRPNPGPPESSDAWDLEFRRALQTIKDLEKEDLALKHSREHLMASTDSNKISRMFPGGKPPKQDQSAIPSAAKSQEHGNASNSEQHFVGYSHYEPSVSKKIERDDTLSGAVARPGPTNLQSNTKKQNPASLIEQTAPGVGINNRSKQDIVNLDEEAAIFLFDRSAQSAVKNGAQDQEKGQPAQEEAKRTASEQEVEQQADAEAKIFEEQAEKEKMEREEADRARRAEEEQRLREEERAAKLREDEAAERERAAEAERQRQQAEKEKMEREEADRARRAEEEQRLREEERAAKLREDEAAERERAAEAERQRQRAEKEMMEREEDLLRKSGTEVTPAKENDMPDMSDYMQLFEQDASGHTADGHTSGIPQPNTEADVQQGLDTLEVESFHYSSGGDFDNFGAESDEYF